MPATSDFNGDGKSDILWRNDDGSVAIWEMNGISVIGAGVLANPGPSFWHIVGTGDFNGDGNSDILWQGSDGSLAIWDMAGTSVIGGGAVEIGGGVLGNPGPSWHVMGTGDFNADGNSDILWQNDDGTIAIWEMNDTAVIGGGVVGDPGVSWHVVGTGDFNGDGNSDILWRNDDGSVAIWEMNGTSVIGGGELANPGPSFWHIVGTGDFNGDGNSDILWQGSDGSLAIWDMAGTSVIGGGAVEIGGGVLGDPGPSWHVMGTGDFNGDGNSDISWQNDDGTIAIWEMNDTVVTGGGVVGNPGASWHVIGGDGLSFISGASTASFGEATPSASLVPYETTAAFFNATTTLGALDLLPVPGAAQMSHSPIGLGAADSGLIGTTDPQLLLMTGTDQHLSNIGG